jgi:MoaA/NifB/PqqE/SkfB family radical SAM enzyme
MFKFNELETIQIEITSRCQASCPMCARNFHGGISNPRLKNSDWSLNDFKNVFDQDVLKQIKKINFCGSFGDPIINSDLIGMCKYIDENAPYIIINIHTNGSARNVEWWVNLAKSLPSNHLITFGIDGLKDTHSLYRIGTDFDKIIENASAFISAGGRAEWAFIKFKHNAHQINEVKELSKKIGFESFVVKNSIRFSNEPYEVYDDQRTVLYTIEPPSDNQVVFVDKDLVKNFQTWFDNTTTECHVLKNKEIYIDAFKTVFPCCWIASVFYMYTDPNDFRYPYVQRIEKECNELIDELGGWESLSFNNNSIKNIINSESWQTIWEKYWDEKKLLICVKSCGISNFKNISKTKDQVVEKL